MPSRRILEHSALSGYHAGHGQWFRPRGRGRITLTEAGVCWVQSWRRIWPRLNPLSWSEPPQLFVPFEEIRSVRFADHWWAPILTIETFDQSYWFRIGRGFLLLSARRTGREWAAVIETRLAER